MSHGLKHGVFIGSGLLCLGSGWLVRTVALFISGTVRSGRTGAQLGYPLYYASNCFICGELLAFFFFFFSSRAQRPAAEFMRTTDSCFLFTNYFLSCWSDKLLRGVWAVSEFASGFDLTLRVLVPLCCWFYSFICFFLRPKGREKEVDSHSVAGLVASLYTAAAAVCKCMLVHSVRRSAPWASRAPSNLHAGFLRHEATEPGVEEEYGNFTCPPPRPQLPWLSSVSLPRFLSIPLALSIWALGLWKRQKQAGYNCAQLPHTTWM